MRSFTGLASFAAFATQLAVEVEHGKHDALEKGAKTIEAEAKRVLGTYDYKWPALQPETVARKSLGDSPLLESGGLRDSIERTVGHDRAEIGSNDDKAVWHELGTSKAPPRPFLSGAAAAKGKEVAQIIGKQVHTALIGKGRS